MTKLAFKTLTFSAVVFVLAASSRANEKTPAAVDPDASAVCPARQAIDRGWELQRELIEARLEARAPGGLEVKGAILSSPFPSFPKYRADLPVVGRKAGGVDWKASGRQTDNHEPAKDRR